MELEGLKFLEQIECFRRSSVVFEDSTVNRLARKEQKCIDKLFQSLGSHLYTSIEYKQNPDAIQSYQIIAESFVLLKISIHMFNICFLEAKKPEYNHSKQSLQMYSCARDIVRFAIFLLKSIIPIHRKLSYSEISDNISKFPEFSYKRQKTFFDFSSKVIDSLFTLQKGTHYFMLNWDLRMDLFYLCVYSLNYRDIFKQKITDIYLNEKIEMLNILKRLYDKTITDLKVSYELTKQEFFNKKIILLLEDYKLLFIFLGQKEKTQFIEKQIQSWNRYTQKKGSLLI